MKRVVAVCAVGVLLAAAQAVSADDGRVRQVSIPVASASALLVDVARMQRPRSVLKSRRAKAAIAMQMTAKEIN